MTATARRTPETTVKANGLLLCTDSFGDPQAPPIVLIMGLGAQMITWDDNFCADLAAKNFHVIRFDNRDIGKSTRMDQAKVPNIMAMMGEIALGRKLDVPYTLKDMAADTVGLMDALGLKDANIVGGSMGGAIAQELAINFPARVRTLTCIFATTGDPRLPPPSTEAMAILLSQSPADRDGYIAQYKKVSTVLRGSNYPEEAVLDDARAIRNFDRGINPPGVTRQLAAIFASGNRTKALGDVTAPTLVIHGDADPLVRVEGGHAIVKAIGRATLHIIKGMGHSLPRREWPGIIDAIAAHAR
jgi:pimeloyl-ACP methyl ester carboxylesterase